MITLRKDKTNPLTRDEMDNNFLQIANKVSLIGDENVDGIKTFIKTPKFPSAVLGDASTKGATTLFVADTISSALTEFAVSHPAQDNSKLPLVGGTLSGNLIIDANLTVSGNITETSDLRVKSEIKPLESSLDRVKLLNGVSYIKDGQFSRNIGLIAQEVIKVVPEVVSTDDNGMLSVSYSNLVALLIEAIKEQDKKIEALTEKLDSLI
jgi:hypothetical protein